MHPSSREIARAVLLLLFSFAGFGHARSQPAAGGDARILRDALGGWSRAFKGFSRARPTVVFTSSLAQCAGCCASAVNGVLGLIEGAGWDANIVVLIATDQPEEVGAVRRLFKHPNVIADVNRRTWKALRAREDVPCVYVLSASGEVLARRPDIQHRYVDVAALNALRWRGGAPREIRPEWAVKLAESKENVVLDTYSPSLNGDLLTFVDPRAGAMYTFNVRDGKVRARFVLEDSVALRFQRPEDNPIVWKSMFEHISQINLPYAAVRGGGDTLLLLGMFHTGYDPMGEIGGRKHYRFRKQLCIATVLGDRVLTVRPCVESVGSLMPPFAFGPGRDVVGAYEWYGGTGNPTPRMVHDSGSVLGRTVPSATEPSASVFHPMLSIARLERSLGESIRPDLSVIPCVRASGDYVFFDATNELLCRYVEASDSVTVLWNGAVPAEADREATRGSQIRQAMPNEIVEESTEEATNDRTVFGVASEGPYVDVVAVQTIGRRDVVVVRRVALDGRIIEEVSVSRNGDAAVSAYPAGYRAGCLQLLVKWKRARWYITGVRLKS